MLETAVVLGSLVGVLASVALRAAQPGVRRRAGFAALAAVAGIVGLRAFGWEVNEGGMNAVAGVVAGVLGWIAASAGLAGAPRALWRTYAVLGPVLAVSGLALGAFGAWVGGLGDARECVVAEGALPQHRRYAVTMGGYSCSESVQVRITRPALGGRVRRLVSDDVAMPKQSPHLFRDSVRVQLDEARRVLVVAHTFTSDLDSAAGPVTENLLEVRY